MRIAMDRSRQRRKGVAAVEFATLAPLLMFLFAIGVDFARAFRQHIIVTNASRSGAIYGAYNATQAADTAGIRAAAMQDASNLDPQSDVSVTVTTSTVGGIDYVHVTVTYVFHTLTNFPGVPSTTNIRQTTTMRIEPTSPTVTY